MTATPPISLVTPTLNAARHLQQALESAALQEIDGLEHIIADGGSTDATLDIVARAGHKPRLLEGTDSGLYEGMNRGLAEAKGEIVGILNADDMLTPGALEKVLVAFQRDPALEIVSGGCVVIDGEGRELRRIIPAGPQTAISVLFGIPAINSRFVRRSFLERFGFFNPEIRMAADREWLWRSLQTAPKTAPIDDVLYIYRAHSGSTSLAGDPATRGRVWREHIALCDRLAASADPANKRIVQQWRALEASKMAVSALKQGAPAEAMASLRSLSRSDPAWATRLPSALRQWRLWRGAHSGY